MTSANQYGVLKEEVLRSNPKDTFKNEFHRLISILSTLKGRGVLNKIYRNSGTSLTS